MKYELDRGIVDDKMIQLGLGSNTVLRDDEFLFVIVEDPKDPIWSTYACLTRLMIHLPIGWQHHIFLSKAPEKILKGRRKLNDSSEAWWNLVDDKKGGLKPAGKLGKNKPTTLFRSLAERCKFDNPERFTSRAARRSGISQMGKAGVNQHLINQKARHSDTSTNKLYNDPHESSLADAAVALHYNDNEDKSSFSTIDVKEDFVRKKKSGFESLVQNDLVLPTPASVSSTTLSIAPVLLPTFVAPVVLEPTVVPAPVAPVPVQTHAPPGPGWYYQPPQPTNTGYHQEAAPQPHAYHPPPPQVPTGPAYGYQYAPAPTAQPPYPSYGYPPAPSHTYPPSGPPVYAPPPPQAYPPTYHPGPVHHAPHHTYPPAPVQAPPAYHPHPSQYPAPQSNMPWPTPSAVPSHPPHPQQAPQPPPPMYYQHPPHGN
jgi:hypothetical protein